MTYSARSAIIFLSKTEGKGREREKRFPRTPARGGQRDARIDPVTRFVDGTKKGVPTGWKLTIRDILEYGGAKFLCPRAGTISMMPGTAADPAYRRVDIDVETGKVSGLF